MKTHRLKSNRDVGFMLFYHLLVEGNRRAGLDSTLARIFGGALVRTKTLALRDGWVDLEEGVVCRSEDRIQLKPKEQALLRYLIDAGPRTVTRGEIMVDVWGYRPDALTRTLDVTVNTLRQKIEFDPADPSLLKTVRGKGYRFHSLKSAGISRQLKTNVRVLRNAFLGREELALEVSTALQSSARLITLVGLGGVGKTRLALELALRVAPEFPGGVWFIDLSDAHNIDDLIATIASTLDLRLTASDASMSIGRAMRGYGRSLWIVDNFEQLDQLASETVSVWREIAVESAFLVTSRRPLSLDAETVFEVEPFSAADGESSAVQLFRARSEELFGPGTLSKEDGPAIEELVDLLEGIPLAIELAAGRSKLLPVAELQNRLRKDFGVLRSRVRDRTRHTSLDASVQWSWDLLTPWKKSALIQCTVFATRFSVTAAEEIIDLSEWPEAPVVLDVLEELVEEHLLARSRIEAAERLEFMDIIRRFVLRRIDEQDDGALRLTRLRHATYFAQFGDEPFLPRVRMPQTRPELHLLSDHLLALDFSEREVLNELALANGRAALQIYEFQGPPQKTLHLLKKLINIADCPGEWRMRLGLDLASIRSGWSLIFDEETLAFLEQARKYASATQDRGFSGAFSATKSLFFSNQGKFREALQAADTAIEHLRADESWSWVTLCLSQKGWCHRALGEPKEAIKCFEQALELEDRNNSIQNGFLFNNLAILSESHGEYETAADHYQRAIDYFESFGHTRFANRSRMDRGVLLKLTGDFEKAVTVLEQVQSYFHRIDDASYSWITSGTLAQVHLARGETQKAANKLRQLLKEVPPGLPHGVFHECLHRVHLAIAWTRLGHESDAEDLLNKSAESLNKGELSETYLQIELKLALVEFCWTFGREDEAKRATQESERLLNEIAARPGGPYRRQLTVLKSRFAGSETP